MSAIHLTKENYEAEVVKSDLPVLIDFWASWCGPCQMIAPVIEELSEELTDAKICKVNVDEQPELAAKFSVMSIPTLAIVQEGKIVRTSVGAKPKEAIVSFIKQ